MTAQFLTVYVNLCIHVHAVKSDHQLFVFILLRHDEGLAIPSDTSRKEAAFCFSGSRERLIDTVIVRQIHALPARIIQ